MKFGQILSCCTTNISNLFLVQYWRLKTSSRPLYDFIQMTIQRHPAIFSSWHLSFLIIPYSPFQKCERTWNLVQVFQIVQKIPENYCLWLYLSVGKVWCLNSCGSKDIFKNACGSKDIFKNATCLMFNTRHDDLVNHEMVKLSKLEYLENGT